ncbi:MAG: tetratricopeptide repeat protein [Treponema sp.]|jgi:putative GTP pyrophosphokinase|nr:tetratricopeptide repeat protein [Treponema sp.]
MKKLELPNRDALEAEYERYAEIRTLITRDLREGLEAAFKDLSSKPTIKSRPKDFYSFFKKYLRCLKENRNGEKPLITDLIGLRIICPFLEDLAVIEELIKKTCQVVELERKGSHYSFKEFGYESTHLLIQIPKTILKKRGDCGCEVAEIQIRTILQDAWAEVEHELVYKAEFTPFDDPMKRKLAAVNASLSLADTIFQEIRTYQRQLNGELEKRRNSFYKKIEEVSDSFLFDEKPGENDQDGFEVPQGNAATIDDLLLNALYAHNKNQFGEAIRFYSRILEINPDNAVSSLIYKHRGMANFAQSKYADAIDDFTRALELDQKSYKAAYYRGMVHSVMQNYAEAVDDFSLSLGINPYQPFCLYRRGQAHYHIEDYPKALADCEAALVLDPKSEPARKFQKLLLNKLKM